MLQRASLPSSKQNLRKTEPLIRPILGYRINFMEDMQYSESIVKEFLLFRGFNRTLNAFDIDLANDEAFGLQSDRIIDLIFNSYVPQFEFRNISSFFKVFKERFLSQLDVRYQTTSDKLEASVWRYYLVYAIERGRVDHVVEFFQEYGEELLLEREDWQPWFALPYIKKAEEHAHFKLYFSQEWLDTVVTSLHNFMIDVFASIQIFLNIQCVSLHYVFLRLPTLLSINEELLVRKTLEDKIHRLELECDRLKFLLESRDSELRDDLSEKLERRSTFSRSELDDLSPRSTQSSVKTVLKSIPPKDSASHHSFVKTNAKMYPDSKDGEEGGNLLSIGRRASRDTTETIPDDNGVEKSDDKKEAKERVDLSKRIKDEKRENEKMERKEREEWKGIDREEKKDKEKEKEREKDKDKTKDKEDKNDWDMDERRDRERVREERRLRENRRERRDAGEEKLDKKENEERRERKENEERREKKENEEKKERKAIEERRERKEEEERREKKAMEERREKEKEERKLRDERYREEIKFADRETEIDEYYDEASMAWGGRKGRESVKDYRYEDYDRQISLPESSTVYADSIAADDRLDFDEIPYVSQEVFSGHTGPIKRCRFSANGSNIATSSSDGTVRIWDIDPLISTNRNATVCCNSEVCSLDWEVKSDRLLFMGTSQRSIKIWNVDSKRVVCDISTHISYPRVVDLKCNPQEPIFVSSNAPSRSKHGQGKKFLERGCLTAWSMRTWKPLGQLKLEDDSAIITSLSFNHNGKLLATSSADGMIRLFDMTSFLPITGWQAYDSCSANCVRFGADQSTLFTLGSDGMVMEWSLLNQGQVLSSHDASRFCGNDPSDDFMHELALDYTGNEFLLTSKSSSAPLFSVKEPKAQLTIPHGAPVSTVDFHPLEPIIATGSIDQSLRVTRLCQ